MKKKSVDTLLRRVGQCKMMIDKEDPERPYSCRGCGAKYKSLKDFIDHAKWCDEFQMLQVQEAIDEL